MTQPLDAVTIIHNAFRRDMQGIDVLALETARGTSAQALTPDRFSFFNEILVWHAKGEELAIFPAVETVAPLVAEAYQRDHHYLDVAGEALGEAVSAGDTLQAARASAAFKFHLDVHLNKEDAHLYRLFRERLPQPEQGKAVGLMASTVPPDRFPDVIAWMFPLLDDEERENMTRIWQMVMPPPVFANVKGLIQKTIGDGWAELVRRIPDLA